MENGARIITELAKTTVPAAMPSLFSNKAEAQAVWDRQGRLLQGALDAQDDLRQLTARAGDARLVDHGQR